MGAALVAVAALALALAACAAGDRSPAAPVLGDRVVVMPVNFGGVPLPQLAEGAGALTRMLERYLRASGREVVAVSGPEASRAWAEATRDFRAGSAPEGVMPGETMLAFARQLARDFAREARADHVVWADIVLRDARWSRNRLVWDGVERPGVFEGLRDSTWRGRRLQGTQLGTSLWLRVLDPSGQRRYEVTHGLEVVHRWSVVERERRVGGEADYLEPSVRDDLGRDDALLWQGVVRALEPVARAAPAGG